MYDLSAKGKKPEAGAPDMDVFEVFLSEMKRNDPNAFVGGVNDGHATIDGNFDLSRLIPALKQALCDRE